MARASRRRVQSVAVHTAGRLNKSRRVNASAALGWRVIDVIETRRNAASSRLCARRVAALLLVQGFVHHRLLHLERLRAGYGRKRKLIAGSSN